MLFLYCGNVSGIMSKIIKLKLETSLKSQPSDWLKLRHRKCVLLDMLIYPHGFHLTRKMTISVLKFPKSVILTLGILVEGS
jgi:hypothetical protein